MAAVKRSVSAPAELFKQADERAAGLGYSTFSQYIQALIRSDVRTAGVHIREVAPEYRVAGISSGPRPPKHN